MTDDLFLLVPHYGGWVVFAATFLSCLALPIPSSMVMLAAGAFVASGDLSAPTVVGAAFVGAVMGDILGYGLGYWWGAPLLNRLARNPARAQLIARARRGLRENGGVTIFLSRWLLSPLGPYVNFACGSAVMSLPRYITPVLAGEALWVTIYSALGYFFAANLEAIADTLGNLTGAGAAGAVALILGRVLLRGKSRSGRQRRN